MASSGMICPFNPNHHIMGTEFHLHMLTCRDKPKHKQPFSNPSIRLPKKKTIWRTFELKEEPENEYFDTYDKEKLMQCPYDANHQIRACRFPYHVIKCKKNHPDVDKQLATCPFNARHQVPRAEISHHISACDDKSCIEQDIVNQANGSKREEVSINMWQSPPCDEDWDMDLQQQSGATFVWGSINCVASSTGQNTLMEQKSNLGSTMRAPKSLPYVLPWKTRASTEYTAARMLQLVPLLSFHFGLLYSLAVRLMQ